MQTNLFEELCKCQNVSENAPTTIGYDAPAAVLFVHVAVITCLTPGRGEGVKQVITAAGKWC